MKNKTVVSKHIGILPKIRREDNSAEVWDKTFFSETLIVILVH